MNEVRWYKGKYKVEVLKKSKGNWHVKALELICLPTLREGFYNIAFKGYEFVTVPRLLWKKPRK